MTGAVESWRKKSQNNSKNGDKRSTEIDLPNVKNQRFLDLK